MRLLQMSSFWNKRNAKVFHTDNREPVSPYESNCAFLTPNSKIKSENRDENSMFESYILTPKQIKEEGILNLENIPRSDIHNLIENYEIKAK